MQILSTLISAACFVGAAKAQDYAIVVPSNIFGIVIEHIEEYVDAQGGTPLVIIVSKIPDPIITPEDISGIAVALTPQPGVGSGDGIARVFAIYDAELECIRERREALLLVLAVSEIVNIRTFLTEQCDE